MNKSSQFVFDNTVCYSKQQHSVNKVAVLLIDGTAFYTESYVM